VPPGAAAWEERSPGRGCGRAQTFVETYTEAPSWSPDGGTIIFKSGTTFDENGLPSPTGKTSEERFAVIDADGGGLHLVGRDRRNAASAAAAASATPLRRPGSRVEAPQTP
jgi:hypothetical protein